MKSLKSLGCLLALLLAAIILLPSKAMAADVAINDTNFPDDNFRSIVADEFDEDLNGTLSTEEIDAIVDLNVDVEGIYDLTGIEHFGKLRILSCMGNELTALDVTHNPELTKLYCGSNSIKKLDVSQNPELTLLHCYSNKLTALDVSKNTKLEELVCSENAIKKLNVSGSTKLGILSCEINKLTKLDVSKNTRLVNLDFSGNAGIAVTGLPKLTKLVLLSCSDCGLTSLDIAANTKLENLYCEGNQITGLDIHLAPALLTAYTSKETLKTVKTNSIFYRYVVEEDDEGIELDIYALEIDKDLKIATAKPTVSTQPKSQTIEPGKKVTFKVTAKGGGLSYQWQYKKPGAASWTNVSADAGKKASYSMTAAARHYKYQYRCKVTNAAGTKYSKAATLTVKTKPVITSPTAATTVTAKKGTTVKLTIKANAAESYQWQYKKPGSSKWLNFKTDAGKKATYTFKATLTRKGYQYRCKVTNPYGTVISKTITLKITS